MFDSLSQRLGGVFDRLRSKGRLSEDDVNAALREVRLALLEADVSLSVVKTAPRTSILRVSCRNRRATLSEPP